MNDSQLVDQIEEIRRRNNGIWMSLLRLALEVAPDRAKALIEQIQEYDSQIVALLREIAEGSGERK